VCVSSEPLIDILAYLEPQLLLKNLISDRNKKVPQKVWFALSGKILASHNLAADWARELL